METFDITSYEQNGYHFYRIHSHLDKDSIVLHPGGLLELCEWIIAHQKELEEHHSTDRERARRAYAEDEKDMAQIAREWRDYRLAGDESPPWKKG